MSDLKVSYPGYDRTSVEGINSLSELPWYGKINLRGNPDNTDFLSAITAALGMAPPLEANTCVIGESLTCFWLGPDEWLVHCELTALDELIGQLSSSLGGVHCAIVDVSDYYTVLRLDGPDSNALLAKACPLDLDIALPDTNACAQTRFGHASILLHQIAPKPVYDIQVRWSFTEYVWDYILSGIKTL